MIGLIGQSPGPHELYALSFLEADFSAKWLSACERSRSPYRRRRCCRWRRCRRQSLWSHYGLGPDFDTGGNYPGFDVTPERDEQLACQGRNGDPWRAPSQSTDALAEPFCQLAAGLVAKPEPCELDHGRPCTRVPSPANAPIAVHTTALVGHRRDADVAGDLSAVAE